MNNNIITQEIIEKDIAHYMFKFLFYNADPDIPKADFDRMLNVEVNRKLRHHYVDKLGLPIAPIFDVAICRNNAKFRKIYKFYDEAIKDEQ